MLAIAFVIVVILAFAFWFAATWPAPPYAERVARGLFLLAAVLWAWMTLAGAGK